MVQALNREKKVGALLTTHDLEAWVLVGPGSCIFVLTTVVQGLKLSQAH